MCGDCIYYPICEQWVEESETFPEIEGGCKCFKNKVDFVEVVRCRDCKYYEIGKSYTPYCNNAMNLFEEMKPTDFCSYGERRMTSLKKKQGCLRRL